MFKKRELEELNKTWETMLMSMIGEQFESHKVVGVVLSKRSKKNLLELWISDRSEETKLMIGEKLRETLNLTSDNLTFYFKEHFKSL
jgi:translation initiation factor 4E